MKKLLIIGFIFTTLFSCGQKKSSEAKVENKEEKSNAPVSSKITAKHIKIPNSNLYIIPPPGFAANATTGTITTGQQHADILIMKIIAGTTPEKIFSELKAQADKDYPGSWKQNSISVDGHMATIYQLKNIAGGQYYFTFNDGHTDEMIIANFEESEPATGRQIYEALRTVVVEK